MENKYFFWCNKFRWVSFNKQNDIDKCCSFFLWWIDEMILIKNNNENGTYTYN